MIQNNQIIVNPAQNISYDGTNYSEGPPTSIKSDIQNSNKK